MYDLIIVGGGPAGLTAGIYAARFNLKAVLIGSHIGGYMNEAPSIENWPGEKSISGMDLTTKMKDQVKELGVEIIEEEVVEVKKGFSVKTKTNKEFKGKNIILALGTERRRLDIKGETEFAGRGVSYCATCDSPFFKDKVVAVAGGANSAVMAAMLLSKFAKEVHILYRKEALRADPYWVDKINNQKNIKVHFKVNIKEIKGDAMVNSILLDNGKEMKLDGVFVEIGSVPATSLATSLGVKLCSKGCIEVDETQQTNVKGVYAAGDITNASNYMRQIITACGEGAIAAESVYKSLK